MSAIEIHVGSGTDMKAHKIIFKNSVGIHDSVGLHAIKFYLLVMMLL